MPTGTKIFVNWCNGNGPFLYELIQMLEDGPYVMYSFSKEPNMFGKLNCVGKGPNDVQVSLYKYV